MEFKTRIDGMTLAALEATGATKWASKDGSIGAFVAEMDFGVAPPVKQALLDAIEAANFGYLPTGLAHELSEATSGMLQQQYGWQVDSSDIHAVPDVLKALEIAIEHHAKPGSKIIVPTPAYTPFRIFPPMLGREVIEVPMICDEGTYLFDMDGVERAFEEGGNLLVVCNPHNPTGRMFSREELIKIGDLVDRHGGKVFADEIWAPLVYPGNVHLPYASINEVTAGHAITAISASKAWNVAGLKCAQVITSNDHDREIWKRLAFQGAHGTSILGAVANLAAYQKGFRWLEEVIPYLDRNRQALAQLVETHLPGVKCCPGEGTYVGWLDFNALNLPASPAAFFQEHANVRLTEGKNCGQGFENFARFIFATPLPIMELAIERMGRALLQQRLR